jgi:CarD family transcriptional regulator, regulator of rRNA transcription
MFRIGRTVVYPRCGPCSVAGVVARVVGRTETLYYHLVVLTHRGDVFVPVDKARALGLRSLLTRADLPALHDRLGQAGEAAADWRQRRRDDRRRLATGTALDLAEIVNSLAVRRDAHTLSFGDSRALAMARELLIDEISRVTRRPRTSAEEQVDRSLERRLRV